MVLCTGVDRRLSASTATACLQAEEDGVECVELLAGHSGHVNYNTVPSIVYTWPDQRGQRAELQAAVRHTFNVTSYAPRPGQRSAACCLLASCGCGA